MSERGSAQVYFFMSREDEDNFLRFAHSTGNVTLYPSKFASRDPLGVKSLPDYSLSQVHSHQFWMLNLDVSPPPITRYVEEKGFGLVDHNISSVIELSRSHPASDRDKELRRGRIYVTFRYVNETATGYVRKEPALEKWYDQLARWIRKSYKKSRGLEYVGPGALDLRDQGWELVPMF